MRHHYPKLLILTAATLLLVLGATMIAPQTVNNTSEHAPKILSLGKKAAPVPAKPTPPPPYTFPDGGRTLFPNYRLVALYGTPGAPVLGALGEQSLPQTITRAKQLAKQYQPYSKQPILPTLEIITTVASATATDNNDYSNEINPSVIQPYINAARKNGEYVVLDLQPGRSTFLSQAKEYKNLLAQPNVGLALDPEWKLTATEVPLEQIGSADIHDINATATWLAALVRQDDLPQKLFLLQQFRLDMLPGRDRLNVVYPQLAYGIQMDGQGTQANKLGTWQAILQTPPKNTYYGWKNFYQKDTTLLTPAQTMALHPQPWYVSYQ